MVADTRHRRALLLLGGAYHDFDGFARFAEELLTPQGWSVESTFDLDRLTRLAEGTYDLVISYTCFVEDSKPNERVGADRISDAQVRALRAWVRQGGGLLAVHGATVIGASSRLLGELIGGVFIEHPPAFSFIVYPVYGGHPIVAGLEAFTVQDELYVERLVAEVAIHAVAIDRGVAHPMVWSRREGAGRVAHVAPGHSAEIWRQAAYRQLVRQAVDWLVER